MFKKITSVLTAAILTFGFSALGSTGAHAATVTINLDCTDLASLGSSDGWETVTGMGQNYVATSGKQKRLVINPNDDYTFTSSHCNFHRAVTPANTYLANSLQLTPSPSNSGTVNTGTWAYGGSSLTSLQVVAGSTLPTMPVNGSNQNYLLFTSGTSINLVDPIVIVFIDATTGANANLNSLGLRDSSMTSIAISPSFSSSTTSYTATTSSTTASLSVNPAIFGSPVSATCNGTALSNYGSSCALNDGVNTMTVVVTGADRTTTKTYTITVTKAAPTAPVIATTSTISSTDVDPTVSITSAATSISSNPSNWVFNTGTTGLTWRSSASSGGNIVFGFRGTAICGGTLTIKAKAAAFVSPTSTLDSNTLSIVIPGATCSDDATLSTTSTIKGVAITTPGTPGTNPMNVVARGSITLTSAQAADTSNSGSFVTSFVANESHATFVQKSKYVLGTTSYMINTYNGTSAISDGDFFMLYIKAQNGSTYKLYLIDVIIGSSGPTAEEIAAEEEAARVAAIAAVQAAIIEAERVRQAAIATAKVALQGVLKSDKPGTLAQYKEADYSIPSEEVLTRVNASLLKLSAEDRVKSQEINKVIKVESFIVQISTTETQKTITAKQLVSAGLLNPTNKNRVGLTYALKLRTASTLDSMEKIAAAIAEETAFIKARAARLEAIKAKVTSRKG